MKQILLLTGALLWSSFSLAATAWQQVTHPLPGPAQSIGSFANACIVGAQPLPLEASGYQVMRQDQRRYFGHPDLILFIQRLSHQVENLQLGEVLIGDMGMPAGGRFSSGHASHQTGLDVDIWLQLPQRRWSAQQLLKPQPLYLVGADGRSVNSNWPSAINHLVKLAAKDNDVTRIFVAPAIKKRLCEDAGSDRNWLRKIRPWFGHQAHMHIRLRCPPDSTACQEQPVPPPGDGCGTELESWFKSAKPGSSPPVKREPPPLPAGCQALLDNHLLQE